MTYACHHVPRTGVSLPHVVLAAVLLSPGDRAKTMLKIRVLKIRVSAIWLPDIARGLDNHKFPHDMNNDRDLLTRLEMYRDDWGSWVALDDLVVGTSDDLAHGIKTRVDSYSAIS